jgi:hypothetical protein
MPPRRPAAAHAQRSPRRCGRAHLCPGPGDPATRSGTEMACSGLAAGRRHAMSRAWARRQSMGVTPCWEETSRCHIHRLGAVAVQGGGILAGGGSPPGNRPPLDSHARRPAAPSQIRFFDLERGVACVPHAPEPAAIRRPLASGPKCQTPTVSSNKHRKATGHRNEFRFE